MKPGKMNTPTDRRRNGKSSTRRTLQARPRGALLKLEGLEERTLLSGTKVIPPIMPPAGLGSLYTPMSEQAHGVDLNSTSPGQYVTGGTTTTNSATRETMAELEAYLKSLGLNYEKLTNAGAGVPTAYQNLAAAQNGQLPYGPPSSANPGSNPNSPNGFYLDNQDNPGDESKPVFNLHDPAALLGA